MELLITKMKSLSKHNSTAPKSQPTISTLFIAINNCSAFIFKKSLRTGSVAKRPSMAYRRRTIASSILEILTLNPVPYPVFLILGVISIFLSISWFISYESIVEAAEEQMSWVLLVIPLLLLLAVHLVSSVENSGIFYSSPHSYRYRSHHRPQEGSSPWGVAALIVLLLVLVQYQSVFHDSWLV